MTVGGLCSLLGIGAAFYMYMVAPGSTLRLRERFRGAHDFLFNRWYFDELYDRTVVRPTAAIGRFGSTVFESAFVQGFVVGGATGVVRAASSLARAIESGYLRAYAFLLLVGVGALVLYFLLASS